MPTYLARHGQTEWNLAGRRQGRLDSGWPGERAARAMSKYTYRFPGGESYADADVRIAQVLASIDVRRALIVSHEMVGRLLVRRLAGLDVDAAMQRDHPSDVVFRVTADGRIDCLQSAG